MPVLLTGKIENVKRRLFILADGWDPRLAKKYIGALGWWSSSCPADTMLWSTSRTNWLRPSQNGVGKARRDQSGRDEARKLFAPVFGWFTDSFDTLDLTEAKALPGELAS